MTVCTTARRTNRKDQNARITRLRHTGVINNYGKLMSDLKNRLADVDWAIAEAALDARGYAVLPGLLPAQACQNLIAQYEDEAVFRKRIVMERHGYGRGEYKYFAYPLPPLVAQLRAELYPPLASIANRWHETLKIDARFPPTHAAFLKRCDAAGQARPTPLMLRYGEGDYNCLHQDLYGAHVFPLQMAVLLAQPGGDFSGGEFVLNEQRPRMQSRAEVVPLTRGDAVIFAVNMRPAMGKRGPYRLTMRHGVSILRGGTRHTLGVIFHDAA